MPALQKIQAVFSQAQIYHGLEGVKFLEQSVNKICSEYNFTLPLAQHHFLLGIKNDRQDNLDLALEHYEQCLSYCTANNVVLRLHTHIMMGSIYADREAYQRAYQLYRTVLDNSHLLDDNYRSLAFTNISDFHLCLKQYDSALAIAEMGEECGRRISNLVNQSICLLNMGYALGHLGKFDEAIKHIEHAKTLAVKINNRRIQAIAFGYIAQVMALDETASVESVIHNFEQADEIYGQVIDTHNRHENLVHFSAYLEAHGHYDRALSICQQAETEITAENNYGFFAIMCKTLIKLYRRQGLHQKVIELQDQFISATENAHAMTQFKEHQSILSNVEEAKAEQERTLLAKMEEHIGLITEIGQYVATTENLAEHLPTIYDKISQVFPTDEFGIALYDEQNHILNYKYFYNHTGQLNLSDVNCKTEYSVGSYVVKHRTTVHLNQVGTESLKAFVPQDTAEQMDRSNLQNSLSIQSLILTPITIGHRVLGFLSIQHHKQNQYQQHHRSLFEQLASFIAIALENHVQRQRLQQVNQKLEVLSKTDPLTELNNRYQLDNIAPRLITNAANEKTNMAVVMIDVDYYKGFNDFYGHHDGDMALKQVANTMRAAFNDENDHLFRYGGDEFLVLCYGQSAELVTQKIMLMQKGIKHLKLMNPLSQCNQYLTLSVGASCFTLMEGQNLNFDALFNLADKELYKVKEKGRNQFSMVSRTTTIEPITS
ncbi:sensor domain-containing diguanylate cyclase [Vibrio atypicus]|uniref:sensor domain-containing diguanylate cyclase n=1 Tax=Vibrio atypicus TaxID=558271 RepID=UPI0037369F9F